MVTAVHFTAVGHDSATYLSHQVDGANPDGYEPADGTGTNYGADLPRPPSVVQGSHSQSAAFLGIFGVLGSMRAKGKGKNMFEFHGWATIRFSPENRDREDEDALQDGVVERVASYVWKLGWNPTAGEVLDIRCTNGETQVWVAGFRNHAGIGEVLLDLFRYIADVAPGSYGLLYTLDDEHPSFANEFRVHVLARGTLTERADPFLSPFVPVVEDPYSDE